MGTVKALKRKITREINELVESRVTLLNLLKEVAEKRTIVEWHRKKLERLVTELRENISVMSDELEAAQAELRRSDALKLEFINIAAHELRTPLTPARGYVEMLRNDEFGFLDDSQKEALEIVSKSMGQLSKLITGLLNITRLEIEQVELVKEHLRIYDVMTKVAEELKAKIETKHHELKLDIPKTLPTIHGDKSLLADMLYNLVSNAIEYMDAGGVITIRASDEGDNLHIAVTDTGIGIPKAEQTRIFDKFYQVSRGDRRRGKGLGVGLYLVRCIVEKHNGKVSMESAVGKGSTFHVTLPKQ